MTTATATARRLDLVEPPVAAPEPPASAPEPPPEPVRVISPAERPLPPLPRWAVRALLVALPVGALGSWLDGGLGDLLEAPALLAALLCGPALAGWAEARLWRRAAPWPAVLRLSAATALPVAGLVGGLLVALVVQVLADKLRLGDVPGVALAMGAFWFAGAALGAMAMTWVDVVVSALVPRFRTRIIAAVLILVTDIALFGAAIGLCVQAAVERLRQGPASGLQIDLGNGPDPAAAQALARWVDAHPQVTTALLVGLAMLVALPAVLSAIAKLADSILERVDPLAVAFQAVAGGARDVHLEEAGSADFVEVSRQFNRMIDELRLAERMERAFGLYVSLKVIDQIKARHGDAALPATLREASVFFADIRGFTSMSERLPPDAVAGLLNRYFERVVDVVEAHDGYLDKFIGDAVVVVFNAPLDQPDHAERATRCALALQRAVREMNAGGAFPEIGELQVGVGIATGPMVCGNIGSSRHHEYTVIGDTVNLAARLCGHAPRGEVWVSDRTAQVLPPELGTEALEPLRVKGKADAVLVWRVRG